jgi:AAA15 family ATPase/GTPase
MLINFSFSNFKSFKDPQQFSLERTGVAQKNEPYDWPHNELSTVAAIYGGNASGKSSFIEALSFVSHYVARGFSDGFDLSKELHPFALDKSSSSAISSFLVDFLGQDGRRYRYELDLDGPKGVVTYESLRIFSEPGAARVCSSRLFEREARKGKGATYGYSYGNLFRGRRSVYEDAVKPGTPMLSVMAAMNNQTVMPAFEFLAHQVGFYDASLYEDELYGITEDLYKNKGGAEALSQLIAGSGFGIGAVQARDQLSDLYDASQETDGVGDSPYEEYLSSVLMVQNPAMDKEERLQKAKKLARVNPDQAIPNLKLAFTHQGKDCKAVFNRSQESNGTLAMLAFFSMALRAIHNGEVAIVDEIDTSLHPILVEQLVELFKDPATNPNEAQLIFTTHDTSLITKSGNDERPLARDQIWFVEKDCYGAATLYPLTSVQSREAENHGRNYLHGIYGAIPDPVFHERFAHVIQLLNQKPEPDAPTEEAEDE